jgi:hypothetical protein
MNIWIWIGNTSCIIISTPGGEAKNPNYKVTIYLNKNEILDRESIQVSPVRTSLYTIVLFVSLDHQSISSQAQMQITPLVLANMF